MSEFDICLKLTVGVHRTGFAERNLHRLDAPVADLADAQGDTALLQRAIGRIEIDGGEMSGDGAFPRQGSQQGAAAKLLQPLRAHAQLELEFFRHVAPRRRFS